MKTRYAVALSLVAGAALGAGVVQGLHAQAKPPAYLVAEVDVSDPEAYAKEYAAKVQPILKAAGARYLPLAGAAASGAKVLLSTASPQSALPYTAGRAWKSSPPLSIRPNTGSFARL